MKPRHRRWIAITLAMLLPCLAWAATETPFHTQTLSPFPSNQSGFFPSMQSLLAHEPALRYQLMFASFAARNWAAPAPSGTLTPVVPAIEAIVNGYYVSQAATALSLPPSARTFVYLDWFDTRTGLTPPQAEITHVGGGVGCSTPISRLGRLLVLSCASGSPTPVLSVSQVLSLFSADTSASAVTATVQTAPTTPETGGGGEGGGAPVDSPYIVKTPVAELTGAQVLSLLPTGFLFNTSGTGALSIYSGATCGSQVAVSLSPTGVFGCTEITEAHISAANKDGLANVPSLRTLGSGALQAAAGNDPRLSDTRTPSDNSVTSAKITDGAIVNSDVNTSAAIDESKLNLASDAAANVASRRTLGTGAQQAASGTDSRFTDQRTPLDNSVTSAKIVDQTIVDADIGAAAAISESKLNLASDAAAGTASRRSLGTGATQAAAGNDARLSDARTPLAHATSHNPAQPDDLSAVYATRAYADSISAGVHVHDNVAVATTANITLSGTQTIDTYAAQVNDRVLVKNQTSGVENGVYVVAAGAWGRATDADQDAEVITGLFVFVLNGGQAGTGWILTTPAPITVGVTSLAFTQFSGAASIQGGAGLLLSGNVLDVVAGTCITVGGDTVGVSAGCLTNTQMSATIQDPVAGTPGLRTLGTGAQQAAAGNDARLSDQRTPSDNSVTSAKVVDGALVDADINASAAIAESKLSLASDAAAGTASRRTLGTGPLQAAAGNDARFTDQRTPTDNSVTSAKIVDGAITNSDVNAAAAIAESKLNLASDAAAATPSRRSLGTGAQQAAAGNDARLSDQRTPLDNSVSSAKIIDGSIVDADVNSGAAIAESKVSLASDAAANVASRRTLGTGATQAAAGNDARFPTATEKAALPGTNGTPSGTNKYVTDSDPRLVTRAPVQLATTANLTVLSGEQTVDSVLTSASRVLVKNQLSTLENGLYVTSAGAWQRATDAAIGAAFSAGTVVTILSGTVNHGTQWMWNTSGIYGTNAALFEVSGAGAAGEVIANKNQPNGYMGADAQGNVPWDRGGSSAVHTDLSSASAIDAATLQVQVIGVRSATAGNVLMDSANPRITGCNAATQGSFLYIIGIDSVRTVTMPTGQGVRLAGNTGSVIFSPSGPAAFLCDGATWIQAMVPSLQSAMNAGRDLFGATDASSALRIGTDANTHMRFFANSIESITGGALATGTTVRNLILGSSGSKPTCDSTQRTKVWPTLGVTGVGATADVEEICVKSDADTYAWTNLRGGAGTVDRSVRITSSASQSIPDNTDTPVAFDVEEFDTDSMHAAGDNTKITFTTAGKYLILCRVRLETNAGGTVRDLFLELNGTTTLSSFRLAPPPAISVFLQVEVYRQFSAADYVRLMIYQDSGGNVLMERDADRYPFCESTKIP